MADTKFTESNRAGVISRTELGVSLADAARELHIRLPTVKSWITRGNNGESGYAEFVADLEAARAKARKSTAPMTPEEHRAKVSEVASNGSVQALRLYWDMIREDRDADDEPEEPSNPLAAVDELARRRYTA